MSKTTREISQPGEGSINPAGATIALPHEPAPHDDPIEFPALPTEVALFVDAGAAWTADESPRLVFARDSDERVPVFSAGIALRTLVLGALPIELYWAKPFQRPDESGVFGFVIAPGW